MQILLHPLPVVCFVQEVIPRKLVYEPALETRPCFGTKTLNHFPTTENLYNLFWSKMAQDASSLSVHMFPRMHIFKRVGRQSLGGERSSSKQKGVMQCMEWV